MIIMGNYKHIPNVDIIDIEYNNILNLSSPINGFDRLNLLPPIDLKFTFDNTFDRMYYEYVINDNNAFIEFMSKIILPVYSGKNVYIIVNEGYGYDYINESIMKMIQARYGVVVNYINDIEDYFYIKDDYTVSFNSYGMINFIQDSEKYRQLMFIANPQACMEFEERNE